MWPDFVCVVCLIIVHLEPTQAANTQTVSAFVIIDVQECFLEGGNLAVQDGNAVIEVINRIREKWQRFFNLTVLTKDWHCKEHVSFASSHSSRKPLEDVELNYTLKGELCSEAGGTVPGTVDCKGPTKTVAQKLWPDHCIANVTSGGTSSNLAKGLKTYKTDIIVLKGDKCQRDSYSAFWDNGNFSSTALHDTLKSHGITTVYLVGLALDFCVFESAKDAKHLGYDTYVIKDATRPVDNTTGDSAVSTMLKAGVNVITSQQLDKLMELSRAGNAQVRLIPDTMLLFIANVMVVVTAHSSASRSR